jgi:hypothetical protein
MKSAWLLSIGFLLATPATAEGGLWSSCVSGLSRLMGIKSDASLSDESLRAQLQHWAQALEARDGRPTYLEEHTPLLLEDLHETLQARLLAPWPKDRLSDEAFFARLQAFGLLNSPLARPLELFVRSANSHDEAPLARLARLRREMRPVDQRRYADEIAARGYVARAEARLNDARHYVARLEGHELVFPDGPRARVLQREAGGALVIELDVGRVLPGQSHIDEGKVQEYMNSDWIDAEIFWGEMTPDGRLKILDQHHRISAYARKHGGRIRARVEPSPEGGYPVSSHLSVLKFYTHWSALPEARQRQVLEQATSGNPLDAIRPVYYELLRLPQPPQ